MRAAHADQDGERFRALSALWLKLMQLTETMSGCHRAFLLGPWLEEAKRLATSPAEAVRLEWSARTLITTWADRSAADNLSNYANRDWQGLMGEVHLPQWRAYLDELADALDEGRAAKSFDWYVGEEEWTRRTTSFPVRATGDAHRTARRVFDVLSTAPYQGTVTVLADPVAFTPGSTGTVTASFRNLNGLRPTGRVDFALTGLDAAATGDTFVEEVAAGGSDTADWRVTAPSEPLTAPLRAMPYELRTSYGPKGEDRVTDVRSSAVYMAAPLDSGWRTYTNNAAVFGQLGERYAINGAGQDLWKGTTEFGTAYREGVWTDGAGVTVRVDAQENTGGWARAGLVVRNSLGTPGSAGFLNLAVTPSNGVVLSYDTNGDGTLDTYRRITGIKAPVLLRLTRAGTTCTGACSTDAGTTWRVVATVTVPGAATASDVGIFMSATNGGSSSRGMVEFSGWQLT